MITPLRVSTPTYKCPLSPILLASFLPMPPSPGFINGTHSTSEAGSPAYGSGETLRPSIYTRGTTSSSHARAEHVYSLINGKGKPWVSLRFQSAAHASTNVPVFWEGDTITGTLNLEVYKAHIVQIDIVVCYSSPSVNPSHRI